MRLIDADGLMEFITENAGTEVDEIIASVCRGAALSMPTIDPVHAAGGCYCRECKRRAKSADLSNTVLCRWLHNLEMPKNGFCNYGEKEYENEN